jgi:hypothetical protein
MLGGKVQSREYRAEDSAQQAFNKMAASPKR